MKQRQAPMASGEIRIAKKHFRLNYTMPEVVALFRDRYTPNEIRQSIAHANQVRRQQDLARGRDWAEKSRLARMRKKREAAKEADPDKRRLIKANNRFASLLRRSGAVEGVVTTPSTKAPIRLGPSGLQFGDSQLAGL